MRGIFDRIAIGPIRRSTIKKVPWSVHSFAREHYPFCIYLIISLSCGYIYIYIYKKCIVFDELTWFLGWKKKKEKKKIVKAMIHWFVRAFRKILRVLICFCSVILGERSSRSKITLSYEIHCDHNDSLIFFPYRVRGDSIFRSGSAIERTSMNKNPRNGDPLLSSLRSSLWRSLKKSI